MDNEFLTIKELAKLLRIHINSAKKYVNNGTIKGFKIGTSWRIRRSDVESFIENQINKGAK